MPTFKTSEINIDVVFSIPFGASQATEYLLKLVQMKYPTFPQRLVPVQSNWLLRTFCEFSSDYPALLRTLKDPLQLRSSERIVQFPYTLPVADERTQEELDRITERRREQGRKLQEMAAKARLEKLVQREAELQHLLELKDRRRTMNKKEWMATLENEGFEDEGQLDATVKKLEVVVKKGKKKAAGEPDDEPVDEEPPSFPLVDVPDDELDEEQIKEKRKQRLMKAGYDARMRTREQKARDAEERAADIKREEEERDRDLTGWSSKLKRDHDVGVCKNWILGFLLIKIQVLITKLKDRMRRKNDLGDRKSAATQARMKNIANLAAEEKRSKGKRKTGGGQ
jgi:actin-related protein 5